MVLGQNSPFFEPFILGNMSQENVFYDILERKIAFLGYKKKKFKMLKNWHFSFWSKNGHFFFACFFGNLDQENVSPLWVGTHLTRHICFLRLGTHIARYKCFLGGGTHITRDMCFPALGTHISRDMCFLGGGAHITRDMCFPVCFPIWRNNGGGRS